MKNNSLVDGVDLENALSVCTYEDEEDSQVEDIFANKKVLITKKVLYSLNGDLIEDLPRVLITSKKGQKNFPVNTGYIFVLRKSSLEYYLISGLNEVYNYLDNGAQLLPVVSYTAADGYFQTVLSCIKEIKDSGKPLHFFDCAERLSTIIKYVGLPQRDLAYWFHVSQPTIGNKVRLLQFSDVVRAAARRSRLSERHCRALLSLENQETQLKAINYITKHCTSAKKVESIVKYIKSQQGVDNFSENYEQLVDKAFLSSTIDLSEEIVSFIENLQREVRILKSYGVDVTYYQRDQRVRWEIQIGISKLNI